MKEVLGKEINLGDILAVSSTKGIEIAIVSGVNEKSVGVIYVVGNKKANLKKSNMLFVIHENNFGGDMLANIQAIRKEVMSA